MHILRSIFNLTICLLSIASTHTSDSDNEYTGNAGCPFEDSFEASVGTIMWATSLSDNDLAYFDTSATTTLDAYEDSITEGNAGGPPQEVNHDDTQITETDFPAPHEWESHGG
jgi:hypothetical protein